MEKSNLDCGFFRIVPSEMTIGQWTHERRRAELIRDDYERGENERRFQKLLLEKSAEHRVGDVQGKTRVQTRAQTRAQCIPFLFDQFQILISEFYVSTSFNKRFSRNRIASDGVHSNVPCHISPVLALIKRPIVADSIG